ncbi:dapper homolog 2 [Nothobranchius furzeri]|nr:dapper homolog 2 [Nothobranchius furzeri]KAF7219618.1 dishevelled-binding antagonist of beta-catenin 2 [Nothobranchius furzeri]
MLSRKSSCAEVMMMLSAAADGVDRIRVGEKLQAALVGLQELDLLKDRQGDMVSWALGLDREEPVTLIQSGGVEPMGAEEQRLEETLTSLKQQLSRLRKQDVGLKTHLQHLDQQINELKLDVSKASTEQLESDSRPSSGFYELSDGGSCSRSNSCTSVYSECLSSSSQSSLVPLSPAKCATSPVLHADVCRRRSADESTTQGNPPRAVGLHLGSSRIRATATGAEQARPRPVSTGDLDKIIAQGLGCFKSADAKKPPVGPKWMTSPMDPKFQRNLERCSGIDVRQYSSPLHAVALQTSIFSQGLDVGTSVLLEGQEDFQNDYNSLQMGYDTKTLDYIDKLLQRSLNRIQRETGSADRKLTENVHASAEKSISAPWPPQARTNISLPNDYQSRHCVQYSSQEFTDKTNQDKSARAPEALCWPSYPATIKEFHSHEISYSSLKNNTPIEEGNHSERGCSGNVDPRRVERKAHWPLIAHSWNPEESQSYEIHSSHSGSPEFVHARFVPAESQRVKVRPADNKTRAVKLKRKSNEKSRVVKHHGERTKEACVGGKGEPRRPGRGKVMERVNACDPIPTSAVLTVTHKVHPKAHPIPSVTKFGKSRKQLFVECDPTDQRKRRQGAKYDVNMFQASSVQRQRSKGAQVSESIQMVRNVGVKPGKWMGPPRPFQSSMFSNSFFHNLNTRYPPAPFPVSGHHPPRCESEYSAECASLFHSTIAESSEGEMSDNTTNCFGDSESSQSFSDSDGRPSLDEGDQVEEEGVLVWAEAALGPTAAGQTLKQIPPRPETSACRIKASRALKKKIRRFQPASLKVITLV